MEGQTLLFETFLPPARYKPLLHVIECVEHTIGIPTFLLNGENLDDFADGYADAGIIYPLSYMQLLGQPQCPVELLAVPVLQEEQQPLLFTIVVRKEQAQQNFDEISAGTWAYYVERHHTIDRFFDDLGTPGMHFKDTIEVTSPAQALRLVLDQKADATAVEARLLELVLRNSPAMAEKLAVLGTYSYSAGPLIVVAHHLNNAIKQQLRDAFAALHQYEFSAHRLQEASIERFLAVNSQYALNIPAPLADQQPIEECLPPANEQAVLSVNKSISLATR